MLPFPLSFQLVHLLVLSLFAVVVLHPELVQHRNDLTATQDVTSFDNNYSAGDSYGYQIMKERKWSSGKYCCI